MKKARICEKCNTINPYHVGNCLRCDSSLKYIDIDDAVEFSEEVFYPVKPDNYDDAWEKTKPTLKDAGKYYTNSPNNPEKKKSGCWTVLWVFLAIFVSFFIYCAGQLGQIGN